MTATRSRLVAVLLSIVVMLSLTWGSNSSAANPITEFDLPGFEVNPAAITAGPDGNIWFVESGGNAVGRITKDGVVKEFPFPENASGNGGPEDIVVGSDSALWFTHANGIGRITTSGTVEDFYISPDELDYPQPIALGGDGALWHLVEGGVGRMTPAGARSQFALVDDFNAWDLATDGEGNIWISDHATDRLARVKMSGSIDYFTVPGAYDIRYLTSSPTGDIWFGDEAGFGSIDPDGNSSLFPLDEEGSPNEFVVAKNGDIWFTDGLVGTNRIGRYSDGNIDWFDIPTPNAYPSSITIHKKYVWFTEPGVDKIGRLEKDSRPGGDDDDGVSCEGLPPSPPAALPSNGDLFATRELYKDFSLVQEVWRLSLDGSKRRRVFRAGDQVRSIEVSPNGTGIAYAKYFYARSGADYLDLWVKSMGVSGQGRRIVKKAQVEWIGWSPDGNRIAFSSQSVGLPQTYSGGLFTVRGDGSGLQRVFKPPKGTIIEEAEWSPDGRWIAMSVQESTTLNTGRLFVTRSNGSTSHEISPKRGAGESWESPSWIPDSSAVAVSYNHLYSQSKYNQYSVKVLNVDKGTPCTLVEDGLVALWSPEGSDLLYRLRDSDEAFLQLDLTTGETHALDVGKCGGGLPTWAPDGASFGFVGVTGKKCGRVVIAIFDLATGDVLRVSDAVGWRSGWEGVQWSQSAP